MARSNAPEPELTVEDRLGTDDPYELVRAKDDQGTEYTTTRIAALNAGSKVLDKPAVDQFGQPHPTKTVLDLRAETNPTEAEVESQPGTATKEN